MPCGCSKKRTYVVSTKQGQEIARFDSLVAAQRTVRANPGSSYQMTKQ